MSTPPAERRWPPLTIPVLALTGVFLFWGLLQVFDTMRQVFFLTFFSVALATIFGYPVDFFSRFLPRAAAVALTFLLLVGLVVGLGFLTIPIVVEQANQLLEQIPNAVERIQSWWRSLTHGQLWEQLTGEDIRTSLLDRLREEASFLVQQVVPVAFGALSSLAGVLLVVVLGLFFAYNPKAYLDGIVRLVPREREQPTAELLRRMGSSLRGWMVGTLASMTIVGTLTGLGLYLVGVESWLVLGVLAFFGEFVPYFGPVLTAVPGIAMGLADSPMTGLYVLIVYVVVQQLEGNLVQPLIMKRAIRVQPGVLLVWQLALLGAFGMLGLIVATPLLAALSSAIKYGYIQRLLGKEERPKQAESPGQA